jgi:hypothetical protein
MLNAQETHQISETAGKATRTTTKWKRLNGEIRDREKTMRGIKTKDTAILQGYQIFHTKH